jgi:hypothetical protein
MPRRLKVRAKFVPEGVDIIDHNGEVLAGITNADALDLCASLTKRLPMIWRRCQLDAGIPIKPPTQRR